MRRGIPLSFVNRKHPSHNLTQHKQALQHHHRRLQLKAPAWPTARQHRQSRPRWRPAACASRAPSPASAAPR
jgi:hypothetical protein